MTDTELSPNEMFSVTIPVGMADSFLAAMNAMNTVAPYIIIGKENLLKEKKEAALKAAKTPYETIVCAVPASSKNHDCWILHKPSKRLFYAPFAHHYQIIEFLNHNYPDVINTDWAKSDTSSKDIRTGDVKNGHPRTALENPVTHKGLRKALVKAFYAARPHMTNPEGV